MNAKPLPILALVAMSGGCMSGSSDGGGNPYAGQGLANLQASQAGYAGGFVDADGDGHEDLVVGAPDGRVVQREGVALVYSGTSGLSTTTALLKGEADGAGFGTTVVNVGDVNGDGRADYAVAAISAEGESPLSGAVYVYRGGSAPPVLLAKLNGQLPLDRFGFAIAAGDVNGDGYSDIVVTAPYTFTDNFQSGAAYVYLGGATFSAQPAVTIKGATTNANLGAAVAAGDVNGDGLADVFVGAGSKVYVYYGRGDFATHRATNSAPDVIINGIAQGSTASGSGFGKAIAYLGDLDGDGFGDIAIGNPNRSDPAIYDNKGSVYVFKGAAAWPASIYENDVAYRLAKIVGASTADRLGSGIAMVGDLDGAGSRDLLVGAPWSRGGTGGTTVLTGNVYLFQGEHLLADPSSVHDPAHAASRYTTDLLSGEYGKRLAVSADGVRFFTGAPLANQHAGAFWVVDARTGVPVVGGGDGGGGGGDHPH